MRKILLAASAALFIAPALAQQPVSSTAAGGTITVTSTFQSALAAPTAPAIRHGCSVQNLGTNNMFVFFGAVASATQATSLKLTPGSTIRCDSGGVVLQDAIAITGTANDTFVVVSQ